MATSKRQIRADASIGSACRDIADQLNIGDRYEVWIVDTANENRRVRSDARVGTIRRKGTATT